MGLGKHYGFDLDTSFNKLDKNTQESLLYGSKDEKIEIIYNDGTRVFKSKKVFEGIIPNLIRRFKESDSKWLKEELTRFQSEQACPLCKGKRLKEEAIAVKIDKKDISEITSLSIIETEKWFNKLRSKLNPQEQKISNQILKEINDRIGFLTSVGLGYLSLNRKSGTLSGGESQRIRLASQIGSGLTGVLYVLDEPSIGLHQRDNEKLLETLQKLRDLGNSVIVVEHDEEAILEADHIVDIGPGAGVHGGRVVSH